MPQSHTLSLPTYPFDYTYLIDKLKGYRYPRNKIQRLVKSGELTRLKKGLYIQSSQQQSIHKALLANMLYGPSYISLEYALSYWGFIPEWVEEVTCVTNKRRKMFHTPLGIFSYRYLPTPKFSMAVEFVKSGEYAFLMATKEKALCEKLYFSPKHASMEEMADYLEQDLRIDMDELEKLNQGALRDLKRCFRHRNVSLFVDWHCRNFETS